MAMNVKKGDTVVVLSGKDKGKQGKVQSTIPAESKVVVEGVNLVTCHTKPRRQGEEGGIVRREAALYASKVQVVCPKCGKGMIRKESKKKKGSFFWSCSGYPACTGLCFDKGGKPDFSTFKTK